MEWVMDERKEDWKTEENYVITQTHLNQVKTTSLQCTDTTYCNMQF